MNQFVRPLKRLFSNHQLVVMLLFIIVVAAIILYWGKMIAPLLAALVIAYLLEGVVIRVKDLGVPRLVAVFIVFITSIVAFFLVLFIVVPTLVRQAKDIATNIPSYIAASQDLIMRLPEKYPGFISVEQVENISTNITHNVTTYMQNFISGGVIAPFVVVVTFTIYFILVPVLVFFLLKDKSQIIKWLSHYLPLDNPLLIKVFHDVDMQTANYIRGKFTEILIVWFASWLTFFLFELNYALLLSFMVGLSVLIPYIGATVVTLPILIVAFVQWGTGSSFYMLIIAYFVIQIIDGNVIVPLIFSEAVSIHPIAIIMAVLFFGGLWGFWGVFFAIPLATLIKAIMTTWTETSDEDRLNSK